MKGSNVFEGEFDRVFDSASSQLEIFEAVEQSIHRVLEGQNSAIFAYGQTNTGKTYTMLGPPNSMSLDSGGAACDGAGLIPRAMSTLFHLCSGAEQGNARFELECSYVQVYNERVLDLLAPPHQKGIGDEFERGHVDVARPRRHEIGESQQRQRSESRARA